MPLYRRRHDVNLVYKLGEAMVEEEVHCFGFLSLRSMHGKFPVFEKPEFTEFHGNLHPWLVLETR